MFPFMRCTGMCMYCKHSQETAERKDKVHINNLAVIIHRWVSSITCYLLVPPSHRSTTAIDLFASVEMIYYRVWFSPSGAKQSSGTRCSNPWLSSQPTLYVSTAVTDSATAFITQTYNVLRPKRSQKKSWFSLLSTPFVLGTSLQTDSSSQMTEV